MMVQACRFCMLARKEGEASIVFEDDKTMAFMDLRPVNDGHTLVIPKAHFESVFDIPDEQYASVYKTVKKVASAVRRAVEAEGISITQHNGEAALQRVFHLHVHVIPRYEGQRFPRPEELSEVSREKLEGIATQIRKYI